MKPHGRDCPRCSLCMGATPQRVSVVDGVLCLDGVPTGREMDNEPRRITARRRARK